MHHLRARRVADVAPEDPLVARRRRARVVVRLTGARRQGRWERFAKLEVLDLNDLRRGGRKYD